RRTIVPIAANHVDRVYPGGSIMAKSGHVIYRFGEPIPYEEYATLGPKEGFEPFSAEAEEGHREAFQHVVDFVMDRIDEGLDERHRYSADQKSDGVTGIGRFI